MFFAKFALSQALINCCPSDLTYDELIKINASNSDQPCDSFGINKNLGQGFADLYNAGEVIFFASEFMYCPPQANLSRIH